MSVTIKKISEISGISRGTVDRVLNHRGRVSADKAQRVLKVAQELGYRPNLAGKALAARKKSFVIGVVHPSEGNPFFDDVILGIRQAEKDLADYGVRVIIRTVNGYDSSHQLHEIDLLSPKVSALILTPLDNPDFAAKIDSLVDDGKCVVTMNTDVKNSRRLCYIGSDYDKGGRIACGLLGLLTGGHAKVGIFTGSKEVLGHNQRIEGFRDVMRTKYPGFSITGIVETKDNDEIGYESAKTLLSEHPETTSAFIVAAGTRGVCRAIASFTVGRREPFPVVSFDILPETGEMIRRGIIQATISQQPFVQGFESVKITFYYLVNNILPEGDAFIVKNEINILESL